MRRPDNQPLDPVTQSELDAIDATLRGDAVEPVYAELAEIALMLQAERPPAPRDEFARELDARVARRFQPDDAASRPDRSSSTRGVGRVTAFIRRPAVVVSTVAAAMLAALVIFVAPNVHSGSDLQAGLATSTTASSSGSSAGATSSKAVTVRHSSIQANSSAGSTGKHSYGATLGSASTPHGRAANKATTNGNSFGSVSGAPAMPNSPLSGRKVKQSTQVELSARNGRVNTVSQELFNMAAAESAVVESSHVSSDAGTTGNSYATFTLSVPDGNLQAMMDKLSSLQYASVVSRQQSTQDVTDQYNADKRALADAQALRTSLLKQLQNAYTTSAIDSLKAQIKDAETQISSGQNRLNQLDHATSYTTVSVQINADNAPIAHHKSSGFTIGRGAHDGLHVLVVAAAVALIVLAVLIPVALIAALLAWIGFWVRQRRREQALDQS
jgi:hypothetical protein